MVSIELLALDQITCQQVAEDPDLFARQRALTLGAVADVLRSVGRQTVAMLQRTSSIAPWTGYLAIDRLHGVIVGTCAFTASPDAEGVVEIAYFTFPSFEGRGYASAMAAKLVEVAEGAGQIQRVRAHTMPEPNASTRILEKTGFRRAVETIDPDSGPVWRWERDARYQPPRMSSV
jgi:ribosomal-protein-alanine N-acetyltransferase